MSFPKTLYVKKETDNEEWFPVAAETLEGLEAENGEKVAVYQLVEVKRLKIKTKLA